MEKEVILKRINEILNNIKSLESIAIDNPEMLAPIALLGRKIVELMLMYLVPTIAQESINIHSNIKYLKDRNIKEWDYFIEKMMYIRELSNKAAHVLLPTDFQDMTISDIVEEISSLVFMFHHLKNINLGLDDIFLNSKNTALLYCVKNISIDNYQILKSISISNIPVDAQFIVFTGNNGEGKTSILQVIAIAVHRGKESVKDLINLNENFLIQVIFKVSGYDMLHIIRKDGFITPYPFIPLLGYGASRLQLQGAMSQSSEEKISSPVYGLFESDSILLNIDVWLREQKVRGNENIVSNVLDTLIQLTPSIDEIIIGKSEDNYPISYKSQDGIITTSKNLSAGNKSILAMIGDMIIRLYQQQPDVLEVSDLQGIVLIDELETHLHPKWQKEFPRLLSELFPKIQFIVTTHSPLVFLGMPPDKTVVYNVGRDENNQTEVKKLNLDLANMLPHEILTSALFDMENIRNVHNQGIEYLSVETTAEKKQREIEEEILMRLSQKFKFNLPESDDKNK